MKLARAKLNLFVDGGENGDEFSGFVEKRLGFVHRNSMGFSDQRIRLPDVEPRTKFAYEQGADGRITLTKLVPQQDRPAKVRFRNRNGRTMASTDRPISLAAIKEALTDFP